MELPAALAGLDDHPWATVDHAYGPAEDLPELLRAFAEGGEDAEEALDELYGSIVHQGTVYAASVDAAPYLARIAASGSQSVDALRLLGCLAESADEHGVEPGAVRAAVTAQLPLLIPLLADEDADVRQAAGWTVGHTRDTGTALPAVRARLATETEPAVRAELLTAYGRLDREGAADQARALLTPDTPAPLRLAAVFAALDADEPWLAAHHDAVLGLLPACETARFGHAGEHREPLRTIVGHLLERDDAADRESALALLDAALRDERPEVRAEALWAADRACALSRSAPQRLVPAIVPLAADRAAAQLLAKLGPAAAEAAPVLAELAARPDAQADNGPDNGPGSWPDDEAADQALAALVLVAPEAAAPLLARALGRRPRAMQSAAGSYAPADAPFPFDPELFAAVRARLAAKALERPASECQDCGCTTVKDNNDIAGLVHLLRRWGPQAVTALPELCAVLPRFPYAATAITAVAADGGPEQRAQAATGLRAEAGKLLVARALHELTGESGPLLAAAEAAFATGVRGAGDGAQAAAALGPAAAPLVPALREALGRTAERDTTPQVDTDLALALALWRITGQAAEAVPVLASVLDNGRGRQWFRWTAARAAREIAALGPAGRPLTARLESFLDDPTLAPSAVLALLAVGDPAVLDRTRLAEAALHSAETHADLKHAVEALRALGASALTPEQHDRLTALATRDRRLVLSGADHAMIREDEHLRTALAALLGPTA
ncbi:HEAT repeat domain-containing protein [Kitasatospora sp. NPDC059160]|uniref:HEAT repeat domain-containing protein n=1 Tax=Kitasatospora sp. NPDC059160 TaxID=3346748 RepID=UPI0036800BE7